MDCERSDTLVSERGLTMVIAQEVLCRTGGELVSGSPYLSRRVARNGAPQGVLSQFARKRAREVLWACATCSMRGSKVGGSSQKDVSKVRHLITGVGVSKYGMQCLQIRRALREIPHEMYGD